MKAEAETLLQAQALRREGEALCAEGKYDEAVPKLKVKRGYWLCFYGQLSTTTCHAHSAPPG